MPIRRGRAVNGIRRSKAINPIRSAYRLAAAGSQDFIAWYLQNSGSNFLPGLGYWDDTSSWSDTESWKD